jgi:protein phosphatase
MSGPRPAAVTTIDCFGLTDVGRIRDTNEDQFVIASMRKTVEIAHTSLPGGGMADRLEGPSAWLFAVADGVGGRPGGEVASSAAVASLVEYLAHATGCFQRFDVDQEHEFLERLEQGVHQVHERLVSEHGGSERAPATTLTLAMLVGERAYLIHVGDSRAYYLRRGRIRQITRDQTIGEYMVDVGAWTEEQAARAAAAASLTSVVGGAEMAPAVGLIDLEPGDTLLLCTDGLTRHLSDADIAAVLARASNADSACRELVDGALAAGGSDNVTVVVARMAPPKSP